MATTKLTVTVDTKLCIGAASCVGVAPQFYKLDEDNTAFLVDPATGEEKTSITFEASDAEVAAIRESVENCPTSAIAYRVA
jgi:ferredoxin